MRFFNIDLHISVIADIKYILRKLGHEVTDWTLSGHAWVMGREQTPTDVINAKNWMHIDRDMCDAFYERYRDELSQFDAFIVTHTPCFSMLFRRWEKPIIVVASTRYEHPFTGDAARWAAFNQYLVELNDSGLLIPLANNRYDAVYAKAFTGIEWKHIPSLCQYTGVVATGEKSEWLAWGAYKGLLLKGIVDKEALRPRRHQRIFRRLAQNDKSVGFRWSDVTKYRGIVHVPYNASLMSLFEHYTQNMPLLVPSKSLMRQLYEEHRREGVLSQLSFNQIYNLPPGSAISPSSAADPNDYEDVDGMMQWIDLADFYDDANMPYIQYFSSVGDLRDKVETLNGSAVSAQMRDANPSRALRVYADWKDVAERVGAYRL